MKHDCRSQHGQSNVRYLAETENSLADEASSEWEERQKSRVRSPKSMWRFFVAVRQHGWMCTEKELWLTCEITCDSTGGRAHSFTAMLSFFICDRLMSSPVVERHGVDRRETGLLLREKTTSLSGTLVIHSAQCAHLLGNELKIGCLSRLDLLLRKKVSFHCLSMQCIVGKRTSSSFDLDSSSLDDVRARWAAIALSVGLTWPPVKLWRDAPAFKSSSWNVLFRSTSSTTTRCSMVSAYSGQIGALPELLRPCFSNVFFLEGSRDVEETRAQFA